MRVAVLIGTSNVELSSLIVTGSLFSDKSTKMRNKNSWSSALWLEFLRDAIFFLNSRTYSGWIKRGRKRIYRCIRSTNCSAVCSVDIKILPFWNISKTEGFYAFLGDCQGRKLFKP